MLTHGDLGKVASIAPINAAGNPPLTLKLSSGATPIRAEVSYLESTTLANAAVFTVVISPAERRLSITGVHLSKRTSFELELLTASKRRVAVLKVASGAVDTLIGAVEKAAANMKSAQNALDAASTAARQARGDIADEGQRQQGTLTSEKMTQLIKVYDDAESATKSAEGAVQTAQSALRLAQSNCIEVARPPATTP